MVDTTSPLLGLLLMGTGGDTNAWGSNLNTQVFTPLENAIAGVTQLSVTGGSHNLSVSEALSAIIVISGVLTSDQTIVIPGTSKTWKIYNNTTGNFFVIIKTASGPGVNVPANTARSIFCIGGGNYVYREDREKVGELFYHSGTSAPAGSFVCNGATLLRASAIDLFAAIGGQWGAGDGFSTFTLPNAQDTGRYLRSIGSPYGTVGTYLSNQFGSHTHTGSGTTGGASTDHSHGFSGTTSTMNQNTVHSHSYVENVGSSGGVTGGGGFPLNVQQTTATTGAANIDHNHFFSGQTGGTSTDHTHAYSFTTAATGGNETRPESMVGLLCIRY